RDFHVTGVQTCALPIWFKQEALATGQDVNKALAGTLSFFSKTQDTDHLSKLNDFAARLAALDTTGKGIEGAASAVKAAMSGNITSLVDFNMSEEQIQASGIVDAGMSGNIDLFISSFEQLLEMQNMGQKGFEQ